MTVLPRHLEELLRAQDFDCIIGVDEAGRGPLCGPVGAGACVYEQTGEGIEGVADSKIIPEEEREKLFEKMSANEKLYFDTCQVTNQRIDEINILQATFEAMTGAVDACLAKLTRSPQKVHVLVDGPKVPPQLLARFACTPVVRGDGKEFLIAAASIAAKVVRDRLMQQIHEKFPIYNLAQHKGYPTAEHMHLVRVHGPCEFHRLTFAPLKHMAVARPQANVSKRKTQTEGLILVDGLRRSARLRCRE